MRLRKRAVAEGNADIDAGGVLNEDESSSNRGAQGRKDEHGPDGGIVA